MSGQVIDALEVEGNRRTKSATIHRLLPFEIGDSLLETDTAEAFLKAARQLYNTKLFVYTRVWGQKKGTGDWTIHILVKERWYTYIHPHFDLIDRNINEWWTLRNRELERVNYGFDFVQKNVSGRWDDLGISLINGHQQKALINYRLRNALFDGRLGFAFGALFQRSRTTNYTTTQDILTYLRTDVPNFRSTGGTAGLIYQPVFNVLAALNIGYRNESASDTLLELNPAFFGQKASSLQYWLINPTWRLDKRDVRGYARSGYMLSIEAGYYHFLNIENTDFLEVKARVVNHLPITKKFNLASSTAAKLSPEKERPYTLNRGLGWDQHTLRGYDLVVADGNAYFYQKLSLRHFLYNDIWHFSKWTPRQFEQIPIKVVPKIFFDFGYVNNTLYSYQGNLLNQSLVSTGIGLDVVLFDDAVWRIEYAISNAGGRGLYLNFTSAIQ